MVGVSWLAWDRIGIQANADSTQVAWAIAACLAATLLYGISANLTKKLLPGVPPMAVAAGSQAAAALVLALPAASQWPAQMPSLRAWAC